MESVTGQKTICLPQKERRYYFILCTIHTISPLPPPTKNVKNHGKILIFFNLKNTSNNFFFVFNYYPMKIPYVSGLLFLQRGAVQQGAILGYYVNNCGGGHLGLLIHVKMSAFKASSNIQFGFNHVFLFLGLEAHLSLYRSLDYSYAACVQCSMKSRF